MTAWSFGLPHHPYITPNSRTHWRVRSANGKAWRSATRWSALEARMGTHERVGVGIEYVTGDNRRRDSDNLVSGVLKHVLDGLVDAGLVPDDTPDYVSWRPPVIVNRGNGPKTDPRWTVEVECLCPSGSHT